MSAVVKECSPIVREMQKSDLDAVLLIEGASYDFPWSLGILKDCLKIGYHCRVVELDGVVIGYGILSIAAEESHLLNICIDSRFRGRGFARFLLDHLIDVAKESGARSIFLEVRPTNQAARRLYRRRGFGEVGIRRHYYPALWGREDALVLSYLIQRQSDSIFNVH